MSPLTMPFNMTLGAITEPSMQPCWLTDKNVPALESPLTLPLICPSRCKPPLNSISPLIRVFAPIKVSTFALLLCFCLNICVTLDRRIVARLRFHRHPLRLPNESLSKTVADISVSAAVNVDSDARRFEPQRQLNGFVVILKVAEGVCQADAPRRRHLRKSQTERFTLHQPIDGDRRVAGHHIVRLAGLHQDELQPVLAGGCLRHNLHLLHFYVNIRVRLHQAPVERQVLIQ